MGEVTNVVDKEALKNAVLEYAKRIKGEQIAFSAALVEDKISIEDKNIVKLKLTSKALDDSELKFGLQEYLRKNLGEKTIKVEAEIVEEEVVSKDEPMEKYIKMKEKNPAVEKIRTQLNLDF